MRSPLLYSVILIGLGLSTGCSRSSEKLAESSAVSLADRNAQVFDAVWGTLDRNYYDRAMHNLNWAAIGEEYRSKALASTDEKALYATLQHMVGFFHDGHVGVYPPAQAEDIVTGQRPTVGLSIVKIDDAWVVRDVFPTSPADKAGVQIGWVVVSRNGIPFGQHGPHLQGNEHWSFRDGTNPPVELALTRAEIPIAAAEATHIRADGVAVIRFDQFTLGEAHWFSQQLKAHMDAPAVIVDLRQNPGGERVALKFGVGEFFDHAIVIIRAQNRAGVIDEVKSWQFGSANYQGKLAVLTDPMTASCSEEFAAVIQETHRGIVVGRKSAGVVHSAHFKRLPDGGMLEYSFEDVKTPGGIELEGHGVIPDIPIPPVSLANLRAKIDPDIETAASALIGHHS